MMSMDLKFSTDQVNSYQINTPVYQGPLDLLLELIESSDLDITTLALAQVTDQYLKHLEKMQDLPPDEISAFLVIAAKLIQIKSEALLPHQESSREEEVDIGDELTRQLIAYKKYKEIADLLSDRKDLGYQTYIRLFSPQVHVSDQIDLGNFGVRELYELAFSVFQKEIDNYLRRKVKNERAASEDTSLPVETRKNARQAAKDIANFIKFLGVPKIVKNVLDYKKVKSGEKYIDPSGVQRIKP